jgi:hypothetical protein
VDDAQREVERALLRDAQHLAGGDGGMDYATFKRLCETLVGAIKADRERIQELERALAQAQYKEQHRSERHASHLQRLEQRVQALELRNKSQTIA